MSELPAWLRDHALAAQLLVVFSVATFAGSAVLLPVLIARLPADYFVGPRPPVLRWQSRHPWAARVLWLLRNGAGLLLLLAGALMLVLPGQGILTVLAGLTLLQFPGKRRLEQSLVRRPRVLRALNWIRARTGQPPFDSPMREQPGTDPPPA